MQQTPSGFRDVEYASNQCLAQVQSWRWETESLSTLIGWRLKLGKAVGQKQISDARSMLVDGVFAYSLRCAQLLVLLDERLAQVYMAVKYEAESQLSPQR